MFKSTIKEIAERQKKQISDEIYKEEGSLVHDLVMGDAIEKYALYNALEYVYSAYNPRQAEGEILDGICAVNGVFRKNGERAKGTITVYGETGTNIRQGERFETNSNLVFLNLKSVQIDSTKQVKLEVEAESVGKIYNIPANALKCFNGEIREVKHEKFDGGIDKETDEELRKRLFESAKYPPSSGNKFDYIKWATEIDGVEGAKILPIWNGAGTVKVIAHGESGNPLSTEKLLEVRKNIEEKRPICAEVTVETVKAKKIDIFIKKLNTKRDVTEKIKDLLKKYLIQANSGEEIIRKKIEGIIASIDEVVDFEEVLINNSKENIQTAEDEKAVLGVVTID